MALLCCLAGSPDHASFAAETLGPDNQSADPALRAAYDAAFKAMLADPGNLDKTFAFAGLAIQTGDYEGAISAFERMLLVDPNLPRVRLELGALYFRLGSFEIARTYLDSALAAPNVPPAVQDRIRELLAELSNRQSPNHFSGSFLSGFRFQTNANTGPPNTSVLVGGNPFTLDERATSKHDWNWFGVLDLRDLYDLQTQQSDMLETTGTLYVARQHTQHQVNLAFLEVTSGPRYHLSALGEGATVKPYVIGDFVGLHNSRDYWAVGAGVDLTKQIDVSTAADGVFEVRDRWFRNSAEQSTNSDHDGAELTWRGQVQRRIATGLDVLGQVAIIDQRAAVSAQANTEYDLTLGATYSYGAPGGLTEADWVSTFTATRAIIPYNAPDPTVDPNHRRIDHDWRFSLVTAVPLSQQWSVLTTLGYTRRDSSIPNFVFDNALASVGASVRF